VHGCWESLFSIEGGIVVDPESLFHLFELFQEHHLVATLPAKFNAQHTLINAENGRSAADRTRALILEHKLQLPLLSTHAHTLSAVCLKPLLKV
jgi:hypothetical protein